MGVPLRYIFLRSDQSVTLETPRGKATFSGGNFLNACLIELLAFEFFGAHS